MESTRERHDFQGITLTTNFAHFQPMCIVNDQRNEVRGIMTDALKMAALFLNLTFIIQPTKPENKNIWELK